MRAVSLRKKPVRHLHQDAGAVAGVHLASTRAPVEQVDEQLQRLADDGVRPLALDVNDEADSAGVVLVLRVVQPLRGRRLETGVWQRLVHMFLSRHFEPEA